MRTTLTNFLPFVRQFTQATNLASMFNLVNSMIYHAKREANPENEALMSAIPMLNRIVSQAAANLKRPGAPPSPGVYALFGAGEEAEKEIYITFEKDGKYIYLVTAKALRRQRRT